jgi:nucleotidyltransferase AbiEii toxin of type IV toxin-antitoxin system
VAAPAIVNPLHRSLLRLLDALAEMGRGAAVIGGIAVSMRTEPRFTKDVDLVVAAADDRDAEAITFALGQRGFRLFMALEQLATERLSTVRLEHDVDGRTIVLDLLFASSGIEPEIVAESELGKLAPGVTVPVARIHHLIALKILARDDRKRPLDRADLAALHGVASSEDWRKAREALALITARGFARGKDLERELDRFLDEMGG